MDEVSNVSRAINQIDGNGNHVERDEAAQIIAAQDRDMPLCGARIRAMTDYAAIRPVACDGN
jgi:hypothetical protein